MLSIQHFIQFREVAKRNVLETSKLCMLIATKNIFVLNNILNFSFQNKYTTERTWVMNSRIKLVSSRFVF